MVGRWLTTTLASRAPTAKCRSGCSRQHTLHEGHRRGRRGEGGAQGDGRREACAAAGRRCYSRPRPPPHAAARMGGVPVCGGSQVCQFGEIPELRRHRTAQARVVDDPAGGAQSGKRWWGRWVQSRGAVALPKAAPPPAPSTQVRDPAALCWWCM